MSGTALGLLGVGETHRGLGPRGVLRKAVLSVQGRREGIGRRAVGRNKDPLKKCAPRIHRECLRRSPEKRFGRQFHVVCLRSDAPNLLRYLCHHDGSEMTKCFIHYR